MNDKATERDKLEKLKKILNANYTGVKYKYVVITYQQSSSISEKTPKRSHRR